MKYLKIFALLFGVASLASCSSNDDDKPSRNSNSGVTVSMADASFVTKENKDIVQVPFNITGDRNGYISVTCTVEEYLAQGVEPAMEDVHYLLTSETVTVWADENSGSFEIKLVDDNIENEPRLFVIKLVSSEGCTIGSPNETIVTIKDNDKDPYDRLGGTWNIHCSDWSGNAKDVQVQLKAYEDDDENYGNKYKLTGLFGVGEELEVNFTYNEATETGNMTIAYGQEIPSFTYSSLGEATTRIFGYLEGSYIMDEGTVTLSWNEDFTEIFVTNSPMSSGDDIYADFCLFADFSGSGYYIIGAVMDVTVWTK